MTPITAILNRLEYLEPRNNKRCLQFYFETVHNLRNDREAKSLAIKKAGVISREYAKYLELIKEGTTKICLSSSEKTRLQLDPGYYDLDFSKKKQENVYIF